MSHDLKYCYKDPLSMLLSLIRKIAAYDEEIQHLYEEMEQQIKKEKEQFLLKVSVSLLLWAWILLPLPVVLYSFCM